MQSNFFERAIGFYLATGALWCFITNVGAAISGAPSAFVVVTGSASAADKMLAVLRIVGGQILLWPIDLYEKVGRIAFG